MNTTTRFAIQQGPRGVYLIVDKERGTIPARKSTYAEAARLRREMEETLRDIRARMAQQVPVQGLS